MSENTNDEQQQFPGDEEPIVSFLVGSGDQMLNPEDLDPQTAKAILESLDTMGDAMPDIVKDSIRSTLQGILDKSQDDSSQTDDEQYDALCCQRHAWELIDELFPDTPHLWAATESLLNIARMHQKAGPAKDSPGVQLEKRFQIEKAIKHLQMELDQTKQPSAQPASLADLLGGLFGGGAPSFMQSPDDAEQD